MTKSWCWRLLTIAAINSVLFVLWYFAIDYALSRQSPYFGQLATSLALSIVTATVAYFSNRLIALAVCILLSPFFVFLRFTEPVESLLMTVRNYPESIVIAFVSFFWLVSMASVSSGSWLVKN